MTAARYCIALAALLAGPAAAAAQDAPLLLTGSDRAVWLVSRTRSGFDVLARPIGGK